MLGRTTRAQLQLSLIRPSRRAVQLCSMHSNIVAVVAAAVVLQASVVFGGHLSICLVQASLVGGHLQVCILLSMLTSVFNLRCSQNPGECAISVIVRSARTLCGSTVFWEHLIDGTPLFI
jgi:hypothetical protein